VLQCHKQQTTLCLFSLSRFILVGVTILALQQQLSQFRHVLHMQLHVLTDGFICNSVTLLFSTPSFWEWVASSTTITRWSLLRRSWVLILKELRNLLPNFMSNLSITLPNLSIPDLPFPTLLSTLIRRRFQVKPVALLIPIDLFIFWRSPSHGAKPLGLPSSQQNSHQGAQACPAHPLSPDFARHLRLPNQAALRCQGEGRGRGWCCWAYPGTKVWKVENQGLARATQPTSRSETWQAGQANSFVGAYKFW